MHRPGTESLPLRVCTVGSGPSAFYATEALFKAPGLRVQVDMFDRLPVPYGLVRGGVAPDHQNIKAVVKIYEKIAANPGFRFFGNVKLGRDLQVADLLAHYHAVIWAVGAESDNKLGVPGEDLAGVHSATEFVGWYNSHPDFRDRRFDLARARTVAVVGNGNVAMDVARVLLQDPAALATTDLAEHALATLRTSTVREVVLLGRRGPAQAAFSPKELEEIAELPDVDVVVRADEAVVDPLSAAWLEKEGARSQQRNARLIAEHAAHGDGSKARKLRCRFLVAPVELQGDNGRLTQVRLQHATLAADADGTPRPVAKDSFETLAVDLVFKAVGYRGIPVPGVPFDNKKGIIPNRDGRVLESPAGQRVAGQYVVGWAKRGPTGLIGTNSADSKATVESLLQDLAADGLAAPTRTDISDLLRQRHIDHVSWQDWLRLDAWEQSQGKARGRVRWKLPSVEELLRTVHALRGEAATQI
ncbi:MAG: NADP oxidoreductase [Planctomycetes bacterium]|nr:NADP oxidoreductase [Planctomycetota bacterium]